MTNDGKQTLNNDIESLFEMCEDFPGRPPLTDEERESMTNWVIETYGRISMLNLVLEGKFLMTWDKKANDAMFQAVHPDN